MNRQDQNRRRRLRPLALLGAAVLVALGCVGAGARQKPSTAGPKPGQTKQPVAQYDIGLISRRLVALEAQVAELEKRNDALASEVSQLKLKGSLGSLKGNQGPAPMSAGPSILDRLNKLEQAMGSHTHYLSGIGVMSLNALPGMQDIANKAGAGYAIQQWKDIKVHVTFGAGAGPERTGPPVPPRQ